MDVLGNKLRVELFDCFMVKPERQGFVVTDRNYQETDFTFDEEIFDLDPDHDCNLVGFFQTDKYFRHIKDRIKEEFTFTDEIKEDCSDILDCFDNPVALHIRREVIISATVIIITTLLMVTTGKPLKEFDDDRQVIIFTDDPKYALENELFSDDRFIVSEGNSSYHDLYMMTQCDDFIICNSTFSWWGAGW